jgi:hypothetical protein
MIVKGAVMKRNRAIIFLGLSLMWVIIGLAGISESGLNNSAILRLLAGGMAAGVTLTLAIKAWQQTQ